jgi:putative transposase
VKILVLCTTEESVEAPSLQEYRAPGKGSSLLLVASARYFLGINLAYRSRMPRKPLIYTHENPYHILARSNNKEWFELPLSECWTIFAAGLNHIQFEYGFSTHLFVLMDNHYHLIGTCCEKHNLGEVMSWFQKYVSRKINARTGRINHIFGGRYKASLIAHPAHFAAVFKYVARNPVRAGICERVEPYGFSTLNSVSSSKIVISSAGKWAVDIPLDHIDQFRWLNEPSLVEIDEIIRKSLQKTQFKPIGRTIRRPLMTQSRYQK